MNNADIVRRANEDVARWSAQFLPKKALPKLPVAERALSLHHRCAQCGASLGRHRLEVREDGVCAAFLPRAGA